MEWIQDNATTIFAVLGALYALALGVVKLTPTPRDDEAMQTVSRFLRVLAAVFGLTLKQGVRSKTKRGKSGRARVEVLVLVLALLLLSGCSSPGDQYQASAVTFVAAVDTAASLRRAGELDEDAVEEIDAAVDEGAAVLHAWAVALEEGRDYPDGAEVVAAVVHLIRDHLKREE